jgi:Rps23 Pro-64 3,4-dihydroxylase Tpa1-like proline 4-hydroxylase
MPHAQLAEAAPHSPFAINPELDVDAIRREFERAGRVRIYNLLSEGAVELYEHLAARTDWYHVITTDTGILRLDAQAKAALTPEERAQIDENAHERARRAFQYRYESVKVPEAEEASGMDDALARFISFVHGHEMSAFLCAVAGVERFAFTEGQVTAYGPGDFLTGHDDDVEGKDRLAAMVFGLTPYWRLEYGGLLIFHGENDRTFSGNTPRFNSLDLFRVPQHHSVSLVTPAAPHRRISITGWLSRTPPDNAAD